MLSLRRRRPNATGAVELPAELPERHSTRVANALSAGQELASAAFPDADIGTNVPPLIRRLVPAAAAELARLDRMRVDQLGAVTAAAIVARTERNLVQTKMQRLEAAHDDAVAGVGRSTETVDGDERDRHRQHEGRMNLRGALENCAVLVMVVGEAAMNFVVLSLLGASGPATWAFTVTIGVALMVASKKAGAAWSRISRVHIRKPVGDGASGRDVAHDDYRSRVRRLSLPILFVIVISLLSSLATLAIVRTSVLMIDQQLLGVGDLSVGALESWALFAALQLLLNATAFAFGAERESDLVESMKQARSRAAWTRFTMQRLSKRFARAVAADELCLSAIRNTCAQFAASGREIVSTYEEAIEAAYDGFTRACDLERAGVLADQIRPTLAMPSWVDDPEAESASIVARLPELAVPVPEKSIETSNGHRPVAPREMLPLEEVR